MNDHVLPLELVDTFSTHFTESLGRGRVVSYEVTSKSGGQERHFFVSVNYIATTRQNNPRFSFVMDDVTGRRLLEEQLRQSEKLQAVGALAGGIAHDFNNQLAGILGYADLLQQNLKDRPDLAEFSAMIISTAERSSRLIAQLLAFSRKGKFVSRPVNIDALVKDVVSLLSRTIDRRIRVSFDAAEGLKQVLGDATQLENAVLNITINARDAMPDGGVITVRTQIQTLGPVEAATIDADMSPGDYVTIAVNDTGIGMQPEIMERIFEPFFTTKEVGRGTGMGLAAVYGTMRNHRGGVAVKSVPGRGSTFTLYLPRTVADTSAVELSPVSTVSVLSSRLTIMVVDDEDVVRLFLTDMLKDIGCTVAAFSGGFEALDYYRGHHADVDVVILDMVMPDLDGSETFHLLKEINPAVKVIVSSGYAMDGRAQDMLDNGAADFLEKPYRISEISEKIARITQRGAV